MGPGRKVVNGSFRPRGGVRDQPTGFQPSVPARYFCAVEEAAWESVSWGRLPFTVAPGPVLRYSANRADLQGKPDMSLHGAAVLTAAGSTVLRITSWPTAVAVGCQGRPRKKLLAAA